MKFKLIILSLMAIASLAAQAQDLPQSGRVYQTKNADLTGDGKPEKIVLVAYNVDSEAYSYWGRLKVFDSNGKLLWAAPAANSLEDPYAFGLWPYGGSEIEFLGDIDGDGKVELLTPEPVSDLRPPTYRRYRWDGKQFQPLPARMLLESPIGSGFFAWKEPVIWDGVQALSWISSIESDLAVNVTLSGANGGIKGGKGAAQGESGGLRVKRWIEPLK